MTVSQAIADLLTLPADRQVAAAKALLASLPDDEVVPEIWNTRFGPGSLFDAWTRTEVARSARAALGVIVRRALDARPGARVIEIGAGNGALWREILRADDAFELVVVEPVLDAIEQIRDTVPAGVRVTALQGFVQDVTLPTADLIVCSLTLHHVAGADAADRARNGLTGPGKLEVLASMRDALGPRAGLGVLVEADIDCDLDHAQGDPRLIENLFDSYVRRCGRSIVERDLRRTDVSADLLARWERLLHAWFLAQIRMADLPIAERDVYELRVGRWLALFQRAGLDVRRHAFCDDLPLFHVYEFGPPDKPTP